MVEDLIGTYGSRLLVAVAGVGIGLVCLIFILRAIRNRAPSPFLRGGRNRQPRLQVLDAAAVDTRRRLVLVRRDDVEHLIMIGGPTDIVIESRIRPEQSAAAHEADDAARQEEDREPQHDYAADDDDFAVDEDLDDDRYEEPPAPPVRSVEATAARAVATHASPAAEWRSRAEAVTQPVEHKQPALALRGDSDPSPIIGNDRAATAAERAGVDPLEAARQRMAAAQREQQAQQPAPPVLPVPVQRPAATATPVKPAATAAIVEKHNDFERLLEAEMAARLEANRVAQPRDAAVISTPRPLTALPPIRRSQPVSAAAVDDRDEQTIQKEMARIFGEGSGKRD